jgi:DNA topoisomerase II
MKNNQAPISKDNCEIIVRSVESFLNNEVKDCAKYIVETRALPNIMDGLRVGARKILYAAFVGDLKKSSKVKMPSLIGDTMKQHYNHSDASLMNTVVQLSSSHVYKYSPFEVIGQIGSLRVPECKTAPRYLHIKKTNFIDFFKYDNELLELLEEDGDKIEPKYFLPIIPIQLLFKTNSPGFGFSYRCFSYDINDVIDNCIRSINEGTCVSELNPILLRPVIKGIKSENMIYNSSKDTWYCVGEYVLNFDKDQLIVTDLPHDISFDTYDETLHNLVEKGIITSFTDLSQDGRIKYLINFSKGRLKLIYQDKWKFYQTFKLFSKITQDTLNFIDEDGKTILFFKNVFEIIDVFIKKRLTFYQKRKTRTINILKEDILDLENKIKFISLINTGELIISNRKIDDIKSDLKKLNIPDYVLKLNISKLTEDEIIELTSEKNELEKYLNYIEKTSIKEMYIIDLIDFKQKYSLINIKSN